MTYEELKQKYQPYLDYKAEYAKVKNAATGSKVDANANVNQKNIATLSNELTKTDIIGMNRLITCNRLTEMFGEEVAQRYLDQLDQHLIYRHDESHILPYCVSITMYPFLFNGLETLGGSSKAPKHLSSFCGEFVNLVFAVAAQFAGAVSTPEFLSYMDYFLRKDYGDDYYLNPDKVVDLSNRHLTIDNIISDSFQQVVYSINQPAAARGNQAVFWNIAYFDHPYFDGMFSDFVFPDGSAMKWESVSWLQKRFMNWFNEERLRVPITFPVETLDLLDDGEDYVDEEWADFAAEMWSKGHSFFMYRSNSVDSLSSCCYSGDTEVLVKDSNGAYRIPLKDMKGRKFAPNGYRIFNNGKWSSGKFVELPNRPMYEVKLTNGAVMQVTDNHRNNTLRGVVYTKDLTTDDYIMMNSTASDTYPEADEKLTYAQGVAIGAFLGDGSMGSEIQAKDGSKTIYTVSYSLSENKQWLIPLLKEADMAFGGNGNVSVGTMYNNVLPVRVHSKQIAAAIMRWTGWERGTRSHNKCLNMDCLLQSIDFRRGIVDGWYATDGNMNSLTPGTSLRGYTTSVELLKDMQAVCTSLGYITSVAIDNRMEKPVFRGVEYNKNFPVYCLLKYAENKHIHLEKRRAIFRDNSYWFRVESIQQISYDGNVYCFEMTDKDDDKFTLANGIHNYNCRLRNELQDNTFSYTLGAGGVSTGSKCVITMNINRLVQNAKRDGVPISDAVRKQTQDIHQYLLAVNEAIKEDFQNHMLTAYDAGYISLDKQYLTVGVNGFVEGAEFLGIPVQADSEEYAEYCNSILEPIYNLNKAARTKEIMINTEFVPAENLGVKFASWDKRDGYKVPRDCYNSYFYIVEDQKTNVVDKLILHGDKFTRYLDGGSACHINLAEHLTKEQYRKLMNVAIKTGCPYFTFNIPNTVCNDCGHISKHRLKACPKCGSTNLDYLTRVIGYMVRVSSFSDARQKEEAKRYYA